RSGPASTLMHTVTSGAPGEGSRRTRSSDGPETTTTSRPDDGLARPSRASLGEASAPAPRAGPSSAPVALPVTSRLWRIGARTTSAREERERGRPNTTSRRLAVPRQTGQLQAAATLQKFPPENNFLHNLGVSIPRSDGRAGHFVQDGPHAASGSPRAALADRARTRMQPVG